ncbi:hypothetical protein RHMOL_Rhmol11G0147600 [Rhododendron molle]|uniref:Uncharacterized protein n=1 Tax=Rhododendron molle TaxID=49168 RepID=A0ACC0LSA2_RHOML|nr:hypothetical protein RHMOL_Rhmol11G0147600 [Rhododendron molle]
MCRRGSPECFPIDDLLDFSNNRTFHHHRLGKHLVLLCVPSDDVAKMEWFSRFVDDSFTDFPSNSFAINVDIRPDMSSHGRSRSKRSRAATPTIFIETRSSSEQAGDRNSPSSSNNLGRRCKHCASEKTQFEVIHCRSAQGYVVRYWYEILPRCRPDMVQ